MTRFKLLKIRKYAFEEMKKSLDPQHDFSHLERVCSNALRIVKILHLGKVIDRHLLEAICYLHDLTFTEYKPGLLTWFLEGYFIKKRLKRLSLFDLLGISQEEKDTILHAVFHHPQAFPLRRLNRKADFYTQILQDADTLDIFSKQRQASFAVSQQRFIFYRLCFVFFGLSRRLYKKRLKNYLNFPELAGFFVADIV